jgi:hypothetical protein
MKSMTNVCLLALVVVALIAMLPANAGTLTVKAKVPFAFEVNGKTMQPGDYVVESASAPGMLVVRNMKGDSALLPVRWVGGENSDDAQLMFENDNGTVTLTGVRYASTDGTLSVK